MSSRIAHWLHLKRVKLENYMRQTVGNPKPSDEMGYKCAKCGKGLTFATEESFPIPMSGFEGRYPLLFQGKMYCQGCWERISRE